MDKAELENCLNDDEKLLAVLEPLLTLQASLSEQWAAKRDAFALTLSQGKAAEFEHLMHDYQELLHLENQQGALDGFKLAVQMLQEVYCKE